MIHLGEEPILRRTLAVTLALLPALCLPGPALAGDPHARPRLVPEQMTAKPGETLWIAIDFELDEGWHTYWPGVNDTGFALDAEIQCSPQAEPGELAWPAPHRYSPSEGMLDHIMTERMTVLLPLAVAPDAKLGEEVSLSLDLRWLVCESACVAESAALTIRIPIAEAIGKPSPETASIFARARARLPRPVTDADGVTLAYADGVLAMACNNSERLAFYPWADSRRTRDLLRDGAAEGAALAVEFREGDKPIRGVLEAWSSPTESRVFEIEWPLREPSPATDPAAGQ